MTPAEKIFWTIVRDRRFNGLKFLRQHPIVFQHNDNDRFFVVDFYSAEAQLIIEIDGGIHSQQVEYDKLRTVYLEQFHLKVVRIMNEELADLNAIRNKLNLIIKNNRPLS